MHKYGTNEIVFYKNNLVANKFIVTMDKIISAFMLSTLYMGHKKGVPFERCILGFMIQEYGSYDVFKKNELIELWEVLKFKEDVKIE